MPKQVSYSENAWGGFFQASVWTHLAYIVWVTELWTAETNFTNKDWTPKKVFDFNITFEIEDEQDIIEDWKPTWKKENKVWLISKKVSCAINDRSHLWNIIMSAYGVQSIKEIKNFSMDKLLWKSCTINVTPRNEKYVKVESTWALSSKMAAWLHEMQHEPFYFWVEDPNDFDYDKLVELITTYTYLGKFEREHLLASEELNAIHKEMWFDMPEPPTPKADNDEEKKRQEEEDRLNKDLENQPKNDEEVAAKEEAKKAAVAKAAEESSAPF